MRGDIDAPLGSFLLRHPVRINAPKPTRLRFTIKTFLTSLVGARAKEMTIAI